MVDEHLEGSALEGLVTGRFSPEAERQHLLHVLFCVTCRERLLECFPRQGHALLTDAFGEVPQWVEPGSLLDRDALLRTEVQAAPLLIEELESCNSARWQLLVRNLPRFQTIPAAAACLAEAKANWHREPTAALDWAQIGLLILDLVEQRPGQVSLVASFKARGNAYRANALRILSKLGEAQTAFAAAWDWHKKGASTPQEWATIAALEASLRRAEGNFDQALALLRASSKIFKQAGERRQEAEVRISLGLCLTYREDFTEAASVLGGVLEDFSPEELGPDLLIATQHNLVTGLVMGDLPTKARSLLPKIKQPVMGHDDRFRLIRVDWLEALILQAEGNWFQAMALFRRVQDAFVEADMAYDAALVALDLAALHLDVGQVSEAKELSTAMLPIFRSRQIHREAATAGLLLIEALKREAAEAELVRELSAYMRQTRRGAEK